MVSLKVLLEDVTDLVDFVRLEIHKQMKVKFENLTVRNLRSPSFMDCSIASLLRSFTRATLIITVNKS